MGLLFIPSPISIQALQILLFPFPQPEVKAFHWDEIILTYFSYRKSLAFNKIMYLLGFILKTN